MSWASQPSSAKLCLPLPTPIILATVALSSPSPLPRVAVLTHEEPPGPKNGGMGGPYHQEALESGWRNWSLAITPNFTWPSPAAHHPC